MALVIHEYRFGVLAEGGRVYRAVAMGERRADGTWIGWLEFRDDGSLAAELQTDRETTQPSFDALRYWARGIEPVYLEGALSRAIIRTPDDVPAARGHPHPVRADGRSTPAHE